jgi:hypothetical protein
MRLFDPIVEDCRQHEHFRALLRIGNGFNLDVMNDWASGFVDRDGKFVEEFQTTFNSSFWELYLFAVIKKLGMQVDFSHATPDFCVPSGGFNIEATIASNAQGAEPEHARLDKMPPSDLNIFNRHTIIRLSNSLMMKHRKYLHSYAKLDHVKDRAYRGSGLERLATRRTSPRLLGDHEEGGLDKSLLVSRSLGAVSLVEATADHSSHGGLAEVLRLYAR